MPISYCPPAIATKATDLAIGLHFRNDAADQDPTKDWENFTEATRLARKPSGHEWGSTTVRPAARHLSMGGWPYTPADDYWGNETHRLAIYATLDPDNTTLHVSVKLETTFPHRTPFDIYDWHTLYQQEHVVQIPGLTGWKNLSYTPRLDPLNLSECSISLATLPGPNKRGH